jgi:hypothetical protein
VRIARFVVSAPTRLGCFGICCAALARRADEEK